MGRWNKQVSMRLERMEGSLASLGNAVVYLRLVSERLNLAAGVNGYQELLLPALEDLRQAERLICRVQRRIKEDFEAELVERP